MNNYFKDGFSSFDLDDEFFEGREVFCTGFDPDPAREVVSLEDVGEDVSEEELLWVIHFCVDLKMTREVMTLEDVNSLDVGDVWVFYASHYTKGGIIPICDYMFFAGRYANLEKMMCKTALQYLRDTVEMH